MKRYRLIVILLSLLVLAPSSAKEFYGYTNERPLIIVCDWDFQPFEYLDSEGHPAGYNIEVLDLILNRLEIPHQFVMQEWKVASRYFENHEADLIHALAPEYGKLPYVQTKKYVNYYSLRAARRVDTPPIRDLHLLDSTDVIAVKANDYAELSVRDMGAVPYTVKYLSPKDGLAGVRAGHIPYYIWGEVPLRHKAQELNLDSIAFDKTSIPAGELHIVGYDKEIIDMIDDEYTRLEESGDLQTINDRWFHPERLSEETSPVALFIVVGLLVLIVIFVLLGRVMKLRVNAAVRRSAELNDIMTRALEMDDDYVLEYDLNSGWVRNVYGNLLPAGGMSIDEMAARIADDEREEFRQSIDSMRRGECDSWTLHRRWNAGTLEEPRWRVYSGSAILEREKGRPHSIVHHFKDVTGEEAEERRYQELGDKYKKVFETNLMAMSFYDASGRLIAFNEKMRALCEFNEERERYFREELIFDDPFVRSYFEQGGTGIFHVCGRMYYPEIGLDKYVETMLTELRDDQGHLVYYIVTSRDVMEEREMYMELRKRDHQLQQTHEVINGYEHQLRYLLEESNMFVWTFDISDSKIRFSRTLREAEYTETLDEYLSGMSDEDRVVARQNIEQVVIHHEPFSAIHHFFHTPLSDKPTWYSLSGIPLYTENGEVEKYFGIVRDITDLMAVQQRLQQETARAEDSGRLKSAFLANMTHEIRTPLNAIVGFSELLQMVEGDDERKEFIRIIRSNCDMLLRLINDILEASDMGQSLTFTPKPIDLAREFDDICQTLSQRVQSADVAFLKDNPYDTCPVTLDKDRLQQVLTNFVTNAVKYTTTGHIRLGYRQEMREMKNGLYFYCEDTGAGIPKEKQSSVFERFVKLNEFVQGTGLGLSICKAIVDKSGGEIGVTSEGEGCGSTFWFWIPKRNEE